MSQSPLTGITHNPWKYGMNTGASSAGAGAASAAAHEADGGTGAALGATSVGTFLAEREKIAMLRPGFVAFAALLTVFALSIGLWSLPILSSWIILVGFGLDVPFNAALIVFIFIGFGTALPNAPGMIGTFQYACILALGLFGIGWLLVLCRTRFPLH